MKKEVKIGIFTILVILGAWAGISFLSGSDLFRSDTVYYAVYDEIGGLQQASTIYIKGVKVGSVTGIELDTQQDAKVTIELTVLGKYEIPKDSKVKIFSDGLIGSKAIDLQVGRSSEYLASGDTITSIPSVDLFDVATDELQLLKSKIDTVANDLSATLQNLNAILLNNATGLESLVANLGALSSNLNKLLEDNSGNIKEITTGFAGFSQAIGNQSESVESIIKNIDSLTQDLDNAEIDATLQEINTLLKSVNSGEGNIGKILNDEVLYENLTSASANLDSLLYDFKLNPKRYIKISIFGQKEEKQRERAIKRAEKEEARRIE